MLVTHEDMNHIVGELWSTVFGLGINPTAPAPFDGRVITATVNMTGDTATSVVVRCGDDLAEQLAARALGLDEAALEPDDLHDTVGEVANILAGNVKAMLGGQLRLSLPAVTDGAAELVEIGRDDVVQDDHFVCNGGHVAVTSKRQHD